MSKARIGEVVEVNPEAMPVRKLPGELNAGTKLERIAQILPFSSIVIAGGKSGGKEKMVEEGEIEVDAEISIEGALGSRHCADERAELKLFDRPLQTLEVEFIFDFKLKCSMLFPIKIKGAAGKREKIWGRFFLSAV